MSQNAPMSSADYQREWRAKHGARTGRPGPEPTAACGTPSGRNRHRTEGTDVCDACRSAYNEAQRRQRAARRT